MEHNGNSILPHYSDFSIYEEDKNYFIIDPSVNFWYKLTPEQLPAFRLLDGRSTVAELLQKVAITIPQVLRKPSFKFIDLISSLYPVKCVQIPKLKSVSLLYLVLIDKCNSNCLYCFRKLQNQINPIEIDLLKNTLRSFKKISTKKPSIIYTGGEPCLYPNLFELVRFAKKNNNSENTLQTNGLLINRRNASAYAKMFDRIQISLDSSKEKINDWLRGKKGHYAHVKQIIGLLLKYDVKVKIATTITKKNFSDIADIKKCYPDVEFQYTPMLQIGKGREVPHLAFSPKEFLQHIAGLPDSWNGFIPKNIPVFGKKNQICGIGTSILSIAANGDVFPCQMLHHPDFFCGNIKNETLEKIYLNSKTTNRMRTLTVETIEECRDCDLRNICAGGCLANGFWPHNKFPVKDTFCEFNKALYFYSLISGFREVK